MTILYLKDQKMLGIVNDFLLSCFKQIIITHSIQENALKQPLQALQITKDVYIKPNWLENHQRWLFHSHPAINMFPLSSVNEPLFPDKHYARTLLLQTIVKSSKAWRFHKISLCMTLL